MYPYLEYRLLSASLDSQSPEIINDFLERNADTPLHGRILFAWARHTGEQGHWDAFDSAWQQIQRPSTELRCLNGRSLLEQDRLTAAWNEARELWTVGHSQPDLCDPLFDAWLQSENFRSSDALQRYRAALISGRSGLSTYVKRFITDPADLAEADRILSLYQNPGLLLSEPDRLKPGADSAPVLLEMVVKRLARQDLEAALRLWIRERSRFEFSPEKQAELTNYLGVWFAKRFPNTEGQNLLAELDPKHEHSELTGWRIRLALSEKKWDEVLYLIAKLPESERQSDRWRYWKAIAQQAVGQENTALLATLAQERSFYGFMAAQILGREYSLNNQPAQLDSNQLEALSTTPAFTRIRELLALERFSDARSEWNLATAEMSPEQIHLAAHLVNRWGWHHQGIRGAISSRQWDDMTLRFPNPYPELFQLHASNRDISPSWALAITRQESAFWMGAKSRVGARGLMQLMPATARATARRHGITLGGLSDLSEPNTNIQLGTAYLSEVFERFNGNKVYATAAYNAGPGRVSQWLDARGKLPLDIWIETIPFDETRNYVQNVLSFRVIYERLNDQNVTLFSEQEFSTLALNSKD
ncbi:lytic transglycosylase Slt [Marinobacterium sediminicola]